MSKTTITKEEALKYHSTPIPGKTAIQITKPVNNSKDLSLAYTPGVAYPCLEIDKNEELAYKYTNKSNLVAVITDSTAVLGLGELKPVAGKPVMEGKAVLFKKFAYIDAFDIELNVHSIDEIVNVISAISPTFGGINLEDIKAPKCFEIEKRLQKLCNIPIFHDDQHGTAIISAAAIINGCEITGKKLDEIKVVIIGAGAAGIAAAEMYKAIGINNIILVDSKGAVTTKRCDLNEYKQKFAVNENITTLEEAIKNADVVIGNSVANCITPDMVKKLNKNAMLFVMSNPDPEIKPELAREVRDDLIIATGRSDYPNQINNVLGFPFIFRGALDTYAKEINMQMKIAACFSLANLAKKSCPFYVKKAYNEIELRFGKDYILPKPFDRRVFVDVSVAVAKASIESGVSRIKVDNIDKWIEEYKLHLIKTLKEKEGIDYFEC
ncbi:malate dehydrogenase [Caminibacter mediatlanticus TB-2]|uniref:Malate dehydrogenase n=1 Tax=Caminibacter mediatlanticus TB-2 TaxID=391592 RepID=A0ABX5V991_9BACT|nr:malic enzyme-like NAD(P)-binding protein [Caminibacter mediatlanticus]QCT94771.1 malate dehydrogenase [Caminibacter mediatlanticus TB-2]